ncbi:MAG: SpoIIE family protein phosphatase [Clostridia bacterium]|nr:SpoIIE family protein phosphatase [Clostridia bacterium]
MLMKEHHCPPDKSEEKCRFKYVTMDEEGPELGIAQWPKEGNAVSGDTVAATILTEDRWLFVLSDGMGSGEEAQKESSGVVRLLEQFLLLDFTLQEAVEMVNSLLLLKGEERFATVDLALLDLANKNLELAKIGAVPSLLINQGNCRVLESNSLPVGILEEIPVETVSLPLETGTVLIMTTDGVWQGPANDQREGWLPEYVQGLWHLSAKDLAQRIVEHSLIMHGGKAEDDLSVFVVRLDW